jgi:hypothetical protein
MTTDLKFPIGKFSWTGPNTDADRRKYIDEIADAPADLRKAIRDLNDQQLDTPYRPDGWTVRQVIHHVPDSHLNSYVRFKLALTEHEPIVKTYDEAAWALTADSRETPIEVSLFLLDNLHARWIVLLRSLKPSDFARTLRHPELGLIDLDRYIALYAWHGKHHVAHITRLRERMGW